MTEVAWSTVTDRERDAAVAAAMGDVVTWSAGEPWVNGVLVPGYSWDAVAVFAVAQHCAGQAGFRARMRALRENFADTPLAVCEAALTCLGKVLV